MSLIVHRIAPRLIPEVEFVSWRKTQVLVVGVHLGETRPCHLIAEGPELGVYARLGSTNRRADGALIAEMRRSAVHASFDEQAMAALDSELIDFRAASEQFGPVRRLRRSDLESLGLVVQHQGRVVPTVGGTLLFGRDRRRSFPDAWIQAGRFAGTDRSMIVDSVDVDGTLPGMVDDALAFLDRHLATALVIDGARHRKARPFPQVALREAVINAVVHADYSQSGAPLRISVFDDRIEVEDPGLLPFGMTVEDMRMGVSRVRNRVVARTFRELGYIEQWGSGVPRMTAACRDAGLPEPQIEEIAGRVRLTLRTRMAAESTLVDDQDQRILELLSGGHGLTTANIAAALGRTTRATRTRMVGLVERGLVTELGSGPTDPRRRYYLVSRTTGP